MTRGNVAEWLAALLVLGAIFAFCAWYSHQNDVMVCQRYGDCPTGK